MDLTNGTTSLTPAERTLTVVVLTHSAYLLANDRQGLQQALDALDTQDVKDAMTPDSHKLLQKVRHDLNLLDKPADENTSWEIEVGYSDDEEDIVSSTRVTVKNGYREHAENEALDHVANTIPAGEQWIESARRIS
jgi:hypothetical protein|tara:strand:+ start:101 stop:508 length:408 start_codon:yes stop_codon:yes gene_type:complete